MSSGVCVLGSTGSVGLSVLDVLKRQSGFHVDTLVAQSRWQVMLEQIRTHRPRFAVLENADAAHQLATAVSAEALDTEVAYGTAAICDAAADKRSEIVVAGIVGAAGLESALRAATAGKKILLANKEPLVMCGDLIKSEVRQSGATILPLDSEHNAIFQSLPLPVQQGRESAAESGVTALLLTGSGGPFRGQSRKALASVTIEQALKHPNWSMGPKITIDSATLMNKGLEVIEACHLFDVTPEFIEVLIHPQSIVHSMVRYRDGSVLAQLGSPDMRTPIAHALAWPQRVDSGVAALDFLKLAELTFEAPDRRAFPCLDLAVQAFHQGGTATTILNAANEVAVQHFLGGNIGFLQIPATIESTLADTPLRQADDLATILDADRQARAIAHRIVHKLQP